MVQRAGPPLSIQFEIINSHSTGRGAEVPRPCLCLFAMVSRASPLQSVGRLGFPVLTIDCVRAICKTSRGPNQNLPLTQVMTGPPRLCPMLVAHPDLCCLTTNCMAQNPKFPLTKMTLAGGIAYEKKHLIREDKSSVLKLLGMSQIVESCRRYL